MLLDSNGLSSKWLVVRFSWEEKLSKHHVEDGEDYNREERRHLYIDYHSLLNQYLFFSWLNSALLQDLKKKKYKIKEVELH